MGDRDNLIMACRDFAVDSINHALDQLERTSPQKQAAPPAVENQVFEAANTTAVDLSYDRPAVIPEVIGHAISSGLIHDDNPVALFIDLSRLRAKAEAMHAAFPAECNVMHAYAIKANPVARIITELASLGGGAECASIVEVEQALKVGIEPKKIIFDSPCKTLKELRRCFELGVLCNLDCLDEVDRIGELLADGGSMADLREQVRVGIRINPQIGAGKFLSVSTATKTSKFGVGLEDHRAALLEAYAKYDWLTGVHCHVGSQGCAVQMLVDGVKTIFGLAEEVNAAAGCQRVKIMDIGGGLPMNYESDIESPTFGDYATMLQEQIPNLFNGKYEICTEFGRTIVQKAGWLLSKVEYTKMAGGRKIVTIHAGSNMFLRTAYLPKTWVHQMTIHQADGTPKTEADGPPMVCDVAGPLCFSGDLMATERLLPECNSGDYLVMHDAGGYTVGMYSRYNSRPCPPVYAYYEDKPSEIITIKKAETCEEVLQFWAATAVETGVSAELEAELASMKEQMAVAQQANEQQKAYSAQLQAKICQLQAQSPSAEWTDWDSPYGTDSGK